MSIQFLNRDPIGKKCCQPVNSQPFFRANHHLILLRIKAKNIKRIFTATYTDALTLSDREIDNPIMISKHLAVQIYDLAFSSFGFREECSVDTAINEILAFRFFRYIRKARFHGKSFDLFFSIFPHR